MAALDSRSVSARMEGSFFFFFVPAPYEQAFCLPDDTRTMDEGRRGGRGREEGGRERRLTLL